MKYQKIIKVRAVELADANEILQRTEFVDDAGRDEVIYLFSVVFFDNIEADIKVCNGDGPFINAILFNNGSEVCVSEPAFDSLEGEYIFSYEDDEYTVLVEGE